MSLGSMTAARIQMGLVAAAVVAVSLVWLLPVGVLGTSTRILADSTNQAEADPLLGIGVLESDLAGANTVANLTSCLFGTDGLGGDITIVSCGISATFPLSSCATAIIAVNSAAAASGGNQTTYARIGIFSGTDGVTLGEAVATTLLTADGPAKGVVGSFIFAAGTTDATANLERALPFYQAIVDNAEITGSSLVLGVRVSDDQCLDPAGGTMPAGTFYMADNSSSLAARLDALGEDVVSVLLLQSETLPAEGARCGFSESRIVPDLSFIDIPQATNVDCSDVNELAEDDLDFYLFPADYLPEDDGGGGDPDGDGVSSVFQVSGVLAVLCAVAMLFL